MFLIILDEKTDLLMFANWANIQQIWALNLNQICTRCKGDANTNVHTCGDYVQIRIKDNICSKFTSSLLLRQMCNFYTHLLKIYLRWNSCMFTPNANLSKYGGKLFVCTYFSPYLFGIKQARLRNIRSDLPYKYLLQLPLSPGQTEPQADASCDSVWPGLACTCVDLRWITLTLVEIKFARKSKQVFESIFLSRVEGRGSRVEGHIITKRRFLFWRYYFFICRSVQFGLHVPPWFDLMSVNIIALHIINVFATAEYSYSQPTTRKMTDVVCWIKDQNLSSRIEDRGSVIYWIVK